MAEQSLPSIVIFPSREETMQRLARCANGTNPETQKRLRTILFRPIVLQCGGRMVESSGIARIFCEAVQIFSSEATKEEVAFIESNWEHFIDAVLREKSEAERGEVKEAIHTLSRGEE